MTYNYTIDYPWLLCNGERVLLCEEITPEQLEARRAEYQALADAPPPEPARPRIPDLSPRQLWLGLMTEEIITPEECEAAGLGTIPAFIEAVIADFPSPVQRAAARVTINKGLTIERNNALVTDALARLPVPPPPEAVDAFFLTYSQV